LSTTVDVTGELSPQLHGALLHRILCVYILSRLSEKALVAAFEALADIYSWQTTQIAAPTPSSEIRTIPVSGVRRTQKEPFIFNDL
jgi:hypothetical protein